VLKTLDRYIDDRSKQFDEFSSPWSKLGRDRKFTVLFSISVVVHLAFYAALIRLDSWAIQRAMQRGKPQPELVKFVEVAPPPEYVPLRRAPEPLERADLRRLQFDPSTADDVHLIPRSPKPSEQRGSSGHLPPADVIENRLRASRGDAAREGAAASPAPIPPATSPIQANRIPTLEEARISATPPAQGDPAASSPPPVSDATADNSAKSDPAPAGTRRGSSAESAALGLEAAQAQYMALVRAKISKVNERIMPREWIKDVLNEKVSADFELVIGRNGQILSARLIHPSGYPVLDSYARQAIYTASPFEGFPQAAGNALTFRVTVYFFTL
jgi:outer membrane biosynthesis protein TonB